MSVKIIIERRFKKEVVLEHLQAIEDLRAKALRQRGYVGGETYVNTDDKHEVIVFSAWSNLDDWNVWVDNQERAELEDGLNSHLESPPKIRAFISSADYIKRVNTNE
ncbi:antibiotic biosynthesis monooxygenase family protein [Thermodesulfobacteriota bacterium]